jgi:AAA+ superfamily predicted ATPase
MEYYSGILFLTTNRPGQLDEAIKPRVHSALLYRTLSLEQTRNIFRLNIKRLEMIEHKR